MTEGLLRGFVPGEYRVHLLSGMLSGPGGPHYVAALAMDVLGCLAKRPGELISRQELADRRSRQFRSKLSTTSLQLIL